MQGKIAGRHPRRVSLWLAVAALVGLFVLTACGGPAPTTAPAATTAPSGQVTPGAVQPAPTPAAAQPKKGGSLTIAWFTGDPPDLDPYLNTSFRSQEFAGFFYSRLLRFKSGPGIDANAFIPEPDLAESFSISADGLTYTFKLRANAKWQNKPPLNGRAVTADDVVYSWARFQKDNVQKAVINMVKEVVKVDDKTVNFVLTTPFAPFESTIATPLFWIIPKEVIEKDGNLRTTVVGSGPFIFEKFEKGVQIIAKRNPDYYMANEPLLDEVVLLVIPEAATTVAGVRAKQIDLAGVSQTDRASLVSTNPELVMFDYTQNLLYFFYWRLEGPPFDNVKVRQAVSMALDRDEIIKVLYEGRGSYNAHIPAGLASAWLDPKGTEFGPNAKYFKRDVEGAKALLKEAGIAPGTKIPYVSTLNAYGNTFNQSVELVAKQLKDVGLELELKPQDYAAYIASTFLGKFSPGTIVWGLETPVQEAHDYLFNMYSDKSARNHAGVKDADLLAMIDKQSKTLDKAERKKQLFDIQRYLAEKQYYAMGPIGRTTIVYQPWVKGFYYQSDYGRGGEYLTKVWIDGKPK